MALPPRARPFRLEDAFARLEPYQARYPKAALFALAEEGFSSVFHVLVGCVISIRTRDEDTMRIARRLFARAPTAEALSRVPVAELVTLLSGSQFPEQKAPRLLSLARAAAAAGGELPCDAAALMAFEGVGPKCANLAVGIACGVPLVSVDTHVHRVANRWGIVRTTRAEATLAALEGLVPKERWIDVNRLVMPFGKFTCKPGRPACEACPLSDMCPKIGVTDSPRATPRTRTPTGGKTPLGLPARSD